MSIAALRYASLALLWSALSAVDDAGAQNKGKAAEKPSLVGKISTLKEQAARLDWLGDRIAFDMRGPNDFFAVYVMKQDGSDVRCLTCGHPDLPQRNIGQPAWHPSGRYLVFQVEKASHRKVRFEHVLTPGAGVLNDLWVLDLKTNRATLLREVEDMAGTGTLHAHFSPDGSKLSWSEMHEKGGLKKGKEFGYWTLMVAEFWPDKDRPRLENVQSYAPGGQAFYENHGFSPDSSQLIFCSNFEAKKRVQNDIYTLELRTKKLTRLTTEGYNEHALYSPDGRHIVWMSDLGNRGGTDYWIMNSDGSDKRRLTYFNQKGHPDYAGRKVIVADISWRPDGTAFAGYYNGGGVLESNKESTKIILIELRLPQ